MTLIKGEPAVLTEIASCTGCTAHISITIARTSKSDLSFEL